MKLAISNIAWEQHDDQQVLDLLTAHGVKGIEVAPTKVWPNWQGASHQAAKAYKHLMADKGFQIPAMQAILFGKMDCQVFDKSSHKQFLEHIKLVADLANGFGSKVMVFGAPKNRKRGQMPYSQAMEVAAEFFNQAAEICVAHDCCIGLEHNPVEYGCDFATNMHDAKELVQKVGHKGFQLHVDSAGLHMNGGDIASLIQQADQFAHYHISEPMLEPIFEGEVDQLKGIKTLQAMRYEHWVSIEMKQPASMDLLEKSLQKVSAIMAQV